MTLLVPLSVRLVTARQDRHVTRNLRDLEFRSVVPGGFASLRMSFDRPLHIQPSEVDYYAGVYVYDSTGGTVWEGRLEDPGRGVGSDGLIWEMAALGPSAHAEDLVAPVVYIDQSLDRWTPEPGGSTAVQMGTQSVSNESEPGWLLQFPSGTVVPALAGAHLEYRFLIDNNQYLARFAYTYQMGVADTNLRLRLFICDLACDTALDTAFTVTKTPVVEVAGTDFSVGRRRPTIGIRRNTAGTAPDDTWWARLTGLAVQAMRHNADGTLKTTGYTVDTVLASEVIADTLARICPRFDGKNATITATGYAIQSLAYPDGATARQIFQDMMEIEPAYYWAAWESDASARVSPVLAIDGFNRLANCVADAFNRTVSNGWGIAQTGQPWTNTGGAASDYSVAGGLGLISNGTVNVNRVVHIDSGATDHVFHIEERFGVTTATGDVIRIFNVGRFQDTSNYYRAQLELATSGAVTLALQKVVAGVLTTIGSAVSVGTNGSASDVYRVTLSCVGSQIRAQAAKIGGIPVTLTATDTSLTTGTRGGVVGFLGSGNTNPSPVMVFNHMAIANGNAGWGTADSGQAWATSGGAGTDFFVASKGGIGIGYGAVHLTQTLGILRQTRIDVGTTDGRFSAAVQVDIRAFAGETAITRVAARSASTGDFYAAEVIWGTDETLKLQIIRVIAGVVTVLAGPVNFWDGYDPFQDCMIVLDLDGANLRAKAWHQFKSEPAGWLLATTDTSITTGTSAALMSRMNAIATNPLPVQFRWSNFSALGRFARHRFEWTTWPTAVRYEADVSDGFDSPGSGQGLWNRVRVRYRDVKGRGVTVLRTQAVPELTDAGLDREAFLDVGNDRTQGDANQAGDAFLTEHHTPPNAGTLTIARPIVDLVSGGMVQPYQVRPGNLIRVRGVLPRIDNLNATDRDGLTVFRIIGVTYRASDATAQLELDSYPLTVAQALAALKRGR